MTAEQIEKFFNKECSADEAAKIAEYLKQHPEVLEKNLSSQEWFEAEEVEMPQAFWLEQWQAVRQRTVRTARFVRMRRWSAAAAVVLIAGSAYFLAGPDRRPTTVSKTNYASVVPDREVRTNTTQHIIELRLPDSSRVRLSPASSITYIAGLTGERREITLEGKAWFSVKKNDSHPFTVYAGGLATTALGTEFTIDTRSRLSVKLHHGKVMISATGDVAKYWKKDIVLLPGQELRMESTRATAEVKRIVPENSIIARAVPRKPQRALQPAGTMDFRNTSLPDVMTRLSSHYHQQISFSNAEIGNMNFTGSIAPDDSLNVVLKIIARMNDLQVERDPAGYSISAIKK